MTNKVSFCILLNKLLISPERNCIETSQSICMSLFLYLDLCKFTRACCVHQACQKWSARWTFRAFTHTSKFHPELLKDPYNKWKYLQDTDRNCKWKEHVCCVYAVHSNTNRMNLSFEICELIFLTLVISTVTDTRSLKILTVLEYN